MSCDVATLPFQANDNYGTWSIDFGYTFKKILMLYSFFENHLSKKNIIPFCLLKLYKLSINSRVKGIPFTNL